MPALKLLTDLIRFPSLSRNEAEIADFVVDYVRDAGLDVERLENNVWFTLGTGRDRLILNSHLDVVPPSNDHPYPPFEPTVVDGAVYGRGAADAKGCVAAMITAVLELADEGFNPPTGQIVVALTACEELGAGYNGLEHLRPHLPELSAGIVGEPTNLQPCVAQKGLLILHLHAKGKSAHAARSHLGINAIQKAARDIMRLHEMTFDRSDPHLGLPTLAVTTISGGTARNVVPDTCDFFVDIRSTPAYSHEEMVEIVSKRVESQVEVHSKRIIPVSTDVNERVVASCLAVDGNMRPFGSPTTSDWIFLHDIPVVKIGPGRSESSHTANEHLQVAELERAVDVYKASIRNYYG